MSAEDKTPHWQHQFTLIAREEMNIDGVVGVGSFDEHEIIMEIEQGLFIVKGEKLNIKQLNLDKGNVMVEGFVKSMVYEEAARSKKGLLERLLK